MLVYVRWQGSLEPLYCHEKDKVPHASLPPPSVLPIPRSSVPHAEGARFTAGQRAV